MPRSLRLLPLAVLAALVCAAPAGAATAALSGRTIVYTADPGHHNAVSFSQPLGSPDVYVQRQASDDDPFAVSGCEQVNGLEWVCRSADGVIADLGDGNDRADAIPTMVPVTMLGGDGDDILTGGFGADVVDGGAGNDTLDASLGWGDVVRGGEGDDVLDYSPSAGIGSSADISGGPGFDRLEAAAWTMPSDTSLSFSLDEQFNDGITGRGADNVRPDVERVESVSGDDTLIGGPGDETLMGNFGNDVIDGGLGKDLLYGSEGDDQFASRDGLADIVNCGGGDDAAAVDTFDTVSIDCEHVERVYRQPPPPPAPAPAAPGAAPVNAGQTATATPAAPAAAIKLSARLSRLPGGRRVRVTGRATRAKAKACSGRVKVTVKSGKRTVATKRVKLSRACTYTATLAARGRKLRATARTTA